MEFASLYRPEKRGLTWALIRCDDGAMLNRRFVNKGDAVAHGHEVSRQLRAKERADEKIAAKRARRAADEAALPVPEAVLHAPPIVDPPAPPVNEPVAMPYDGMSIMRLRAFAGEHKIDLGKVTRKADLLELVAAGWADLVGGGG